MDYNELYHHGVLGMKWGVIRSKVRGLVSRFKSKKPNTNEETKEHYEARKEKALKSGTASEILKFKGDLTNQQMQNAVTRINLEKQLSDISDKERKRAMDKVDSLVNNVDKITSGVEKGIKAYNTGARIYNSLNKKGTNLPTIEQEGKKKKNPVTERLIKSGSAKEIAKHFGEFTPEELKTINQRFVNEEAIRKRIT